MVSVLTACAGASDGPADDENPDPIDAEQDLTSTVRLAANGVSTVRLASTSGGAIAVSIDCHPPADPDEVGPTFRVVAPALGVPANDTPRAGLWARSGTVPAGQTTIELHNLGPAASCSVKSTPVAASQTCKEWSAWRSPNTGHTHLRVGVQAIQAGWEPFPASGNHWGAWSMWNTVYKKPIQRGFLLHNLEHGGLVLSYKCSSETESAACTDAKNKLAALAQQLGTPRMLITPDPTQPSMFAIRAWRTAYTSDCFDLDSAKKFATEHFNHGREDIDANPPIPFDPTTTNVPCQDLMAAPDSCN